MTTTSAVLENEVFVGAGAGASLIPELDIFLGDACTANSDKELIIDADYVEGSGGADLADLRLIDGLYTGCMCKIVDTGTPANVAHLVIKGNTHDRLTFDESIVDLFGSGVPGTTGITATIMGYGAPAPAPVVIAAKPTLLSDNWLGLVNTITPPSVEVELGQLNLAMAGTRNFQYQFKKNETVSGGSMDISLNNGSWLYYALGNIASVGVTGHSLGSATNDANSNNLSGEGVALHETDDKLCRVIGGKLYPPSATGSWKQVTESIDGADDGYYSYTFTESNGDTLPSFALDVSYEKAGLANDDFYVGSEGATGGSETSASPFKDIYSRVFTGCQVNTLTLNFEEGMELKGAIDFSARRAFDAPQDVTPKRRVRTSSDFFNYNSQDVTNQPYLFSGGSLTLFGQTLARVKQGSLAINNNLNPHRFIGNYSRDITSTMIPGQRTYEITMTVLVTDTKIWDNLRAQGEHTGASAPNGGNTTVFPYTGELKLRFEKDANFASNVMDAIEMKFQDYIVQSVTVPFPDDKGPIEVEMTISARTLSQATYTGNWRILHSSTGN